MCYWVKITRVPQKPTRVIRSFSIVPYNIHKYDLKLGFKFIKKKINKFLFLKIKI